jgi:hypothetical protein
MIDCLLAYDDTRELGKIRAPTQLLWGDHDALFSRAQQDAFLAALPAARLKVYQETGHCPNWERPEWVAADIADLVAGTARGWPLRDRGHRTACRSGSARPNIRMAPARRLSGGHRVASARGSSRPLDGHGLTVGVTLMFIARTSILTIAAVLAASGAALAQVPDDLRAAMRARDTAFYAVDAAQWEKYTASAFTTVQQDGSFMTRAERLANLRKQTPRPYVPRSREQNERRGELVVARFFSGGLWVLEVWTRETGAWVVLMSQVTTAKP